MCVCVCVCVSVSAFRYVKVTFCAGISSSIAKTLGGGSFISKVLLANADALCAAASPLLEQDIPL